MVVQGPALIEINGSICITVDEYNNITIDGHNKVFIRSSEIDMDADNISIRAKDKLYIGTENEVEIQTKKINLNPKKRTGGYSRST